MTNDDPSTTLQTTIRFSRTVGLVRAIAQGSSISIGLGVFILLNLFLPQGGWQTPGAYLAAMLLFVPLALTYAERAAVTPGSGGAFSIGRPGGATWRTYANGWLLLGGHLALIALLAWGAALYLDSSLERLLGVSIELRWLAPAMVILVALNDLIGTQGGWRLRTLIIYSSVLVLLGVASWLWFLPAAAPTTRVSTGSINIIGMVALMAASLWGIQFVLDNRDEMRRPSRNMLPALLIPLVLSGIIGAVAAASELSFLGGIDPNATPLMALVERTNFAGATALEAIYITTGLLISLIALDQAMVTMLHLSGAMARDGFLPKQFLRVSSSFGTPFFALQLFAVGGAIITAFVSILVLVGLVALAFLWMTALLCAADITSQKANLPAQRYLKLPFHPLFPVLATVIGIFLPLTLQIEVLLIGLGWIMLGALYYYAYARRAGLAARRRDTVLGDVARDERDDMYTVLVGIANPETAPALIRAGALLACRKQGRVLALQIVACPDQVPPSIQRQEAEKHLQTLNLLAQQAAVCEAPVEVLVRIARSPVDGLLSAAEEEKVDMIVLGWEGEHAHEAFDLGPLLDPIVRAATCDVVVIRGKLPVRMQRILIPTAGSPNTVAAMKLAQDLVDAETGKVVALNLAESTPSSNGSAQNKREFEEMLKKLGGEPPIELRVLPLEDVKAQIVREARDFDVLVLGASRGGALDQAIFGGLPVETARAAPGPTLLVKHFEGTPRFWVRRIWETISAPFPSLTVTERAEVYQHMRRAARPSVDFFVLIALSAMIATFGLLQNSPAVIIGAMLVAPLMSPIISMAMSIVQGNLRLLRVSTGATLLGIVMAISVGITMTLLSPTRLNTAEILARTQPNLLDLFVALASGAAGGYAVGRKEVAAALPGVAIAAALVPPLGVVGYGTATAQLTIAGGSLLLFTTNLIEIVFAAAVVFLLLGFRPTRTRLREQVRLGLIVSVVALVSISIPLAIFSVNAVEQVSRQNRVETFLRAELDTATNHITDILVERRDQGFRVQATIYTLDDFGSTQITALQERLSAEVGAPVTLQAMVLQAMALPNSEEVRR
ncbi:MAG: DUF389 domain-containing protein [Chloroflexales bacterium]|nr:DUF389 domain-containing protein [Chloroflexales bacterium]